MSTINYALKEISCKIVYYGPGLGGKTTNLQYIYNSLPQKNRGELVSLATQQDRTLFFDFLPMDIGKVKGYDTKFHLYTVPGQVYYNATRKLVLRGVDGIVFVADSQRDRLRENIKSLQNLRENLLEYNYDLDNIPWVIQYNKRDLDNICSIEELEDALNPDHVPYYESVATTGKGVKETLKAISAMVLERLGTVSPQAEAKTHTHLATLSAQPPPLMPPPAKPPTASPEPPPTPQKPQPAAPEETLSQILPISQKCHIIWQGIRVGSGEVSLARVESGNTKAQYRLGARIKILAFFKRQIDKRLIYLGEKTKSVNGREFRFFLLTDPPEERPPLAEPFRLWVKGKENKTLYSTFDTRYGKVSFVPQGEKPIDM